VLADSGLPVIHATEALQQGITFGERLASSFAHAFAAGYEQVIAVGNDCPRLHEVDWTGVVRRLENGQPVVGPTTGRDGAYLIGLHQSHFHAGAFAALPWQSERLYDSLLRHLTVRSSALPHTLASRSDLNSRRDLLHFLQAVTQDAPSELCLLARRLQAILGVARSCQRIAAPPRATSLRVSRGRSPPVQTSPV